MKNGIVLLVIFVLLVPFNFTSGEPIFSHMFGTEGDDIEQFRAPSGIAIDESGKIYVAEYNNNRVQVLDYSGKFISFIVTSGQPHGIEIDEGKIYVANWSGGGVQVFDSEEYNLLFTIKSSMPADIAIDESGKIFITEHQQGIVKIFDSFGGFLSSFDIPETTDGYSVKQLNGITIDNTGTIYVTDYGNDRVMKFDSSGNFLSSLVVPDEDGGGFSQPTNIEIDPNNDVFVTDNSGRVLVFDSSDNFLYSFGEDRFSGPHGIAFDDFGNIYVAEWGNRVSVFTSNLEQQNSKNDIVLTNSEPTNYLYLIIPGIIVIILISLILKRYAKGKISKNMNQ